MSRVAAGAAGRARKLYGNRRGRALDLIREVEPGANAVAVETGAGWEVLQFRTATLVGDGTWRLTSLLRGQQGTEEAMRTGAAGGALVVLLDAGVARATIGRSERGLPLLCRAGPAGAPPGGAGFAEANFTLEGLHHRPWSVAGLAVEAGSEGLSLGWSPRARLYGDSWDGEVEAVDADRFRVRVMDGAVILRTFEVVGNAVMYAAAAMAVDFPTGPGAGARIGVAQWGAGFGWGVEAVVGIE